MHSSNFELDNLGFPTFFLVTLYVSSCAFELSYNRETPERLSRDLELESTYVVVSRFQSSLNRGFLHIRGVKMIRF